MERKVVVIPTIWGIAQLVESVCFQAKVVVELTTLTKKDKDDKI
jgi:hypothetical protein